MKSEPSRTIIGSVVCVDLVGYSLRAIADQITIKEGFNRLLAEVLRDVPLGERIILDTGDGAAVTFLGDPDKCLDVTLEMRDVMNAAAEELGAEPGNGPVRIAVSLGPLKVGIDMNGRPNIVGDGMNVAERIVAFAKPGQIVASRAFHDMVSRLSAAHQEMFRFEGKHADRNAREHEIYLVEDHARVSRSGSHELPATTSRPLPAAASTGTMSSTSQSGAPGNALVDFLSSPAKVATTAMVLLGVIFGVAWWVDRKPEAPAATVTTPVAPEPIVKKDAAPAPPPVSVPAPVEPAKPPPDPAPAALNPEAPKAAAASTPPPLVSNAPAKAEAPKLQMPPQKTESTPAPPPPASDYAPATVAALVPISREPVSFPRSAVSQGVQSGVVKARLAIAPDGRVTDVHILASDPPRIFDREAVRALLEWRFRAGSGQRSYEVEIEFKR